MKTGEREKGISPVGEILGQCGHPCEGARMPAALSFDDIVEMG